MLTSGSLPVSDHFVLYRLADGVYAAIATDDGAAYSNAAIVDLGGQTLILDTFESPLAARDLRVAAEQLTGRLATCVIISHAHADHWLGNQVFADHAPILTTHDTRALMPEMGAYVQQAQADPAELQAYLRENETALAAATDPRRRASLQRAVARARYLLAALPDMKLCLPTQTFKNSMIFHGGQRTAEMHTWNGGHTASDAYLVLPTDKAILMGDLGFFQCQPFMPYGDPPTWVALLEKLAATGAETFVPGHGPLGTKTDLALQREYLTLLPERVGQVVAAGGTEDDALHIALPVQFEPWLMGGIARFEANVRFVYQRLAAKEQQA